MRYIVADPKYRVSGGLGHIFHEVLSSYIIAHLYDLKFVYSPLESLGDQHHSGKNHGYKEDSVQWDSFLRFSDGETLLGDMMDLTRVEINLCNPFDSIDNKQLGDFIQRHSDDNILFVLTNNNRVYLNEVYYFNRPCYTKIFENLKSKLKHLETPKNNELTVAMHIRRGDWDWQPLSYNIEFIKLLRSVVVDRPYRINVYSLGTDQQMEEIRMLSQLDENITFHFNTDVFETFSGIYNADIVVGGHSNFPKTITMFSHNKFVYLPYKDGITRALGNHQKSELYYLGHYPELFDEDNRIETDVYCQKNREAIMRILNF